MIFLSKNIDIYNMYYKDGKHEIRKSMKWKGNILVGVKDMQIDKQRYYT